MTICMGCGKPIQGPSVTAMNSTWHPEHFICVLCGKPIGYQSFFQSNGKPVHEQCYCQSIAPLCAYCGKPLLKSHLVDYWGNRFCPEHRGKYPSCRFCGRLVPQSFQGSTKGSKEGVRCTLCRSRAVDYMKQAQELFPQLIQWVNQHGLYFNHLNLHIRLLYRAVLGKLSQDKPDTKNLGVTLITNYTDSGNHFSRSVVNGVAILRGLPTPMFEGVTVHELGHAWMAVHNISDLPKWASEGFCEFINHFYLQELNTKESIYHAKGIAENRDPDYGGGYRNIQNIVNQVGLRKFISHLQVQKTIIQV